MDVISCECCGTVVDPTVIAVKRGYCFRRCASCGLTFVHPQPDSSALARLYSGTNGYYRTAVRNLECTSNSEAIWLNGVVTKSGIQPGAFLDVGCSTGSLMFHLQRLGWSVSGLDMNPEAVTIATDSGLCARVGELRQDLEVGGPFDVAHLADVLEHVPSPKSTLLAVRRQLRKGGLVILRLPNGACGFAAATLAASRLLGGSWMYSEAPYHLFEFTLQSLSELLSQVGFEVLEAKAGGRLSFPYVVGASGHFDDLKVLLKSSGNYRLKVGLVPKSPKLAAVSALLAPLYAYGLIYDRLHGTYPRLVVIARKSSA